MATIGLRDLYRASVTEATANGVTTTTYGTPVRLAKAITANLTIKVAEAQLDADDAVDDITKEFVSGELKLGVNDLLPADLAEILGQSQDEDDVVYGSDADEAPYVAIGFRSKKPNGLYKYLWFYKVKFAIPDENYKTKGEGIEYSTPEIVGTILKRPDDGRWKAEHVGGGTNDNVASGWFSTVRAFATT